MKDLTRSGCPKVRPAGRRLTPHAVAVAHDHTPATLRRSAREPQHPPYPSPSSSGPAQPSLNGSRHTPGSSRPSLPASRASRSSPRGGTHGDVEPGVGVPPRAPRASVYRTAQRCRHSRAGRASPRAGSTTAPGRDRCGGSSQPPSTSSIWRSRSSIWSISFCCCVIARTIAARRCSRVRGSRARCRSASVRARGASDGGPHDREPPHL
jgi:hypothetical protein